MLQVLINPEIVEFSDDAIPFEEGCLSFPRIFADVTVQSLLQSWDLKGGCWVQGVQPLPWMIKAECVSAGFTRVAVCAGGVCGVRLLSCMPACWDLGAATGLYCPLHSPASVLQHLSVVDVRAGSRAVQLGRAMDVQSAELHRSGQARRLQRRSSSHDQKPEHSISPALACATPT